MKNTDDNTMAVPLTGMVISLAQGRAQVELENCIYDCLLSREIALAQQTSLAVGDQVILSQAAGDTFVVTECLPRKTVLSRPDPQSQHIERVIAANIEMLVIVVSAKAPPLRVKLIDRYLIAAQRGAIEPIICLNKIDLLKQYKAAEELEKLQPYRNLHIKVIECSAESGAGIDALKSVLSGKLCVFVGHSGVGKSSLLNTMNTALHLPTNTTRKGDHKGRHTTSASICYQLGDGIRVIDTPGIREFGLWKMQADELRWYFPEFADYAARCRFKNCMHATEPNCAVMRAVREGLIARARYDSYCRLLSDLDATRFGGHEPELSSDNMDSTEPVERGFRCTNCGEQVMAEGAGTRHRNHCPKCLWSVHLDDRPGDRAACCGGLMEPVAVWVRKGGEWAIIHRCRECGELSSNRIAADDNEMLLLSLAVKPLAMPPFPLDKILEF